MVREQYEINWKDYYRMLGVNRSAEAEVVKAAYGAMARKYHPDKGGSSQQMKEINEAYEVLCDSARKAAYDVACGQREKSSGNQGGYSSGSGSYQHQGQSYSGTSSGTYDNYDGEGHSEPRQQAARSSPLREKLLPWPSWYWQRLALFSCFPTALCLVFIVHNAAATALGLCLLVTAVYACARTRCLNRIDGASMGARFAAGFVIVLGLGIMGTIAIVICVPLAIIGLVVFLLVQR